LLFQFQQVSNWRPELMEVEDQAKQVITASLLSSLFFLSMTFILLELVRNYAILYYAGIFVRAVVMWNAC